MPVVLVLFALLKNWIARCLFIPPITIQKKRGKEKKKGGLGGGRGWETDSADNQVTTCDHNSNKYNNNQKRYFMDSQSALIGFLLEC